MYDEGYGSGMSGFDWVATVAGRFLTSWERSELASGWWAGQCERRFQLTKAPAEPIDWTDIPL